MTHHSMISKTCLFRHCTVMVRSHLCRMVCCCMYVAWFSHVNQETPVRARLYDLSVPAQSEQYACSMLLIPATACQAPSAGNARVYDSDSLVRPAKPFGCHVCTPVSNSLGNPASNVVTQP